MTVDSQSAKPVVTRKWIHTKPYSFRLMGILDRIHFGFGVILDRHPKRIVSLNIHLGPYIVKFQVLGDLQWLRKKAIGALKDDIAFLKKLEKEYK